MENSMNQTNNELMKSREAAQFLNVSSKTLWLKSSPRGDIPVIRFDRCVRYSRQALREWMERKTVPAGMNNN